MWDRNFTAHLASAQFCLVFAGGAVGGTVAVVEAIVYGCVPIIIKERDDFDLPFENLLPYDQSPLVACRSFCGVAFGAIRSDLEGNPPFRGPKIPLCQETPHPELVNYPSLSGNPSPFHAPRAAGRAEASAGGPSTGAPAPTRHADYTSYTQRSILCEGDPRTQLLAPPGSQAGIRDAMNYCVVHRQTVSQRKTAQTRFLPIGIPIGVSFLFTLRGVSVYNLGGVDLSLGLIRQGSGLTL
eukprot:1186421-Prorocentrum_minimum.AAC.9